MKKRDLYIFASLILAASGCSNTDVDPLDTCPDDDNKTAPGICGCGTPDTDENNNGILDCIEKGNVDLCPDDDNKTLPGLCGCGTPDVDENHNDVVDCIEDKIDLCPDDDNKNLPGACGCGKPDTDTNGDTVPDCLELGNVDLCPDDDNKTQPGICDCGTPDVDENGDGLIDCIEEKLDLCPDDADKKLPGICGCGTPDVDENNNGIIDCIEDKIDLCPNDDDKLMPGICGCGTPDTDSDGDGLPDCKDECKDDPNKFAKGFCGCGNVEDLTDSDNDGTPDCADECPFNPFKTNKGMLGCDADDDDNDGVVNTEDACPFNPNITKLPEGADPATFSDENPYYCNIVKEKDTDIFEIWSIDDFEPLNAYMREAASKNNFLNTHCILSDQRIPYCAGNTPIRCADILSSDAATYTVLQVATGYSCKDGSIQLPEESTPVDTSIKIDPATCAKDGSGHGACCDPKTYKPSDSDEKQTICFNGYLIEMTKSGGKAGDFCVMNAYQSADFKDGKTLACVEQTITSEKEVTIETDEGTTTETEILTETVGILKDMYVSGGKAGELCAPSYRETCTDDSNAVMCIDGIITDIACATKCERFATEANHVACIPGTPAKDRLKIRLMRDINIAEMGTDNDGDSFGCSVNPDEWNQAMLYHADFDGQNHRIFLNNGTSNCIAPESLFSQVIDTSIHDLKVDLNVKGRASAVIAQTFLYSEASNLSISGDVITDGSSTMLSGGESSIPTFGAVAGIAYRSLFSDIDISGKRRLSGFGPMSTILGATEYTILKNSTFKSDLIDGESASLAMYSLGRSVLSNVKIDINQVNFISVVGVAGLIADMYDVDLNIHQYHGKSSYDSITLFSIHSAGLTSFPSETIRFHATIDSIDNTEIYYAYVPNPNLVVSDFTLKDSSLHLGDITKASTVMLFNALNNATIEKFDIQLDTLLAEENTILFPETIHSQFKDIKLTIGNYDVFPIHFNPFDVIQNSTMDGITLSLPDIDKTTQPSLADEETTLFGFNRIKNSTLKNIDASFGKINQLDVVGVFLEGLNESTIENVKISLSDITQNSPENAFIAPLGLSMVHSTAKNITISANNISNTSTVFLPASISEDSTLDHIDIKLNKLDNLNVIELFVESIDSAISNVSFTANAITNTEFINALSTNITSTSIDNVNIHIKDVDAKIVHSISDVMFGSNISNSTIRMDRVKADTFSAINTLTSENIFNNVAHYADVQINEMVTGENDTPVKNDLKDTAGFINKFENHNNESKLSMKNTVIMTKLGLYQEDGTLAQWLNTTPLLIHSNDDKNTLQFEKTYILKRDDMCTKEAECTMMATEIENGPSWFTPSETNTTVSNLNKDLPTDNRTWESIKITENGKDLTIPWMK